MIRTREPWSFPVLSWPQAEFLRFSTRCRVRYKETVRRPSFPPAGLSLRPSHAGGPDGPTRFDDRGVQTGAEMSTRVLSRLARAGYGGLVVSEAEMEYQNVDDMQKDVETFENWHERFH